MSIMLRQPVAMSRMRTLRRACCRSVGSKLAAPILRTSRMVSAKATHHFDDYAISLDEALHEIMTKVAYDEAKARTTAPPRSSATTTSLPRAIADRAGLTLTQTDFERIMGTNDLVGVEYMEQGMRAAAAVARILILDPDTGKRGYATGFMVAPRLLLTNRHVLPNIDVARASMAEFGYEYDVTGITKDTEVFKLNPDEVFIVGEASNKDVDFALVAVAPYAERSRVPLATYGHLRLDDKPGKVAEQEFITIIQHPGGRHKQVALRENEIIAKGPNDKRPVLLYRSDTAPGSSGSPCFNDQWQVVALHSQGVPKTEQSTDKIITRGSRPIHKESMSDLGLDESDIVWEANLGVRISFIVDSIRRAQKKGPQRLVTDFLADVQRGGPPVVQPIAARQPGRPIIQEEGGAEEVIDVESPDFADLAKGYDPGFLGPEVPLPVVTDRALQYGRPLMDPNTGGDLELKYPHFSVIMNFDRRLAFVSACNIDGKEKKSIKRSDKFFVDPRIDAEEQTSEYLYKEDRDNFFDRGHLTRRDDVAWGKVNAAQAASDASFAFPNISPQHKAFNQSGMGGVWGELENYVLDNTVAERLKASVFNGPIFDDTDLWYKGVPIPKMFYKLVVVADPRRPGGVRASAYIASQAELVRDDLLIALAKRLKAGKPFTKPGPFEDNETAEEEAPIGDPVDGDGNLINVEQVTIAELESLTGLQFADVVHEGSVMREPARVTRDRRRAPEATEAMEAGQVFPRKTLRSLGDVVL